MVEVDYTDPNRIENTLLRSNVKVINPNSTIIYSCPVMLPGRDDTTSVFVAPRGLGIKVGDVLSGAQAGGLMHRVNLTTNTGKIFLFLQNRSGPCTLIIIIRHESTPEMAEREAEPRGDG